MTVSCPSELPEIKLEKGRLRCQKNFSAQETQLAIHLHDQKVQQQQLLKDDRKRRLSRIKIGERRLIVKEYRQPHWWLFSQDWRGWRGSHRLSSFTASCLAWFRSQERSAAFLIFEDVGDHDLFMRGGLCIAESEAEIYYRQAGSILGHLHRSGLFHADTKPSNFVIGREPEAIGSLYLVDCDDVRQYWHLSSRRRIRNLAQFAGGLEHLRDLAQRQRLLTEFFQGYCESYNCLASSLSTFSAEFRFCLACLYPKLQASNEELLNALFASWTIAKRETT